jgi:nucleotide-binding universal stress UspA family protein
MRGPGETGVVDRRRCRAAAPTGPYSVRPLARPRRFDKLAARGVGCLARSSRQARTRSRRKELSMTIIVAFAPQAEGRAALDKGIEIAGRRKERLLVVNAISGANQDDPSRADVIEIEAVEKRLADSGLDAAFKQFVRGKNAVTEIVELAESPDVSLVIVGLRKRSPVGKLIMGSVSRDILLSVRCPVLAVKAAS